MNYVYEEYDQLRPELYQEWLKEVREGRGLDLSSEELYCRHGHLLDEYTGIVYMEEDFGTVQLSKWKKGKLHCETGPALVFWEGTVLYYLNHEQFSVVEFWKYPLVLKCKLNRILEL